MREPQPAAESSPNTLRTAVLLIWLEAAGVAGLAAFLVYELFAADATSIVGALFVTACAIGAAAALAALGRALHHRRGGARGVTIVLQLMLMPVGYYMLGGELTWLGVLLMGLGLGTSGLLVAPSSTRALGLTDQGRPR